MYELFILSELMEKPRNGYNLRVILQKMVGNERNISFGMLYPQLERLEEKDYITTSVDQTDSKRTSKINVISSTGKNRFYELMVQSVPVNQNTQLTYEIKIGSFHLVSTEIQKQIITEYVEYLENKIKTNQEGINVIRNEKPAMSNSDRADTIETIELRLTQTSAALTWAENKLTRIEEQ